MALSREQLKRTIEGRSVKGAALLERLARGRDHRRRMTWPGGSLEIELQILTRAETADAHADAIAACAARGLDGKSMNTRAVEAMVDEEITQTLARAVRDPATHEPLTSAADLAAVATEDELVALYNAYSDLRHAADPEPDELPEDEFRALEDAVKKKDEHRLNAIVSSMPRPWLRSSVLRLVSSLSPSSISTGDSSSSPTTSAPAATE